MSGKRSAATTTKKTKEAREPSPLFPARARLSGVGGDVRV